MTRILYAEDDGLINQSNVRFMNSKGYEVISTLDGREALERFKQERAIGRTMDFLITDVIMLPMNGLELIKGIRAEGFNGPIAINSTNPGEEFLRRYGVVCVSSSIKECLDACEVARQGARA